MTFMVFDLQQIVAFIIIIKNMNEWVRITEVCIQYLLTFLFIFYFWHNFYIKFINSNGFKCYIILFTKNGCLFYEGERRIILFYVLIFITCYFTTVLLVGNMVAKNLNKLQTINNNNHIRVPAFFTHTCTHLNTPTISFLSLLCA